MGVSNAVLGTYKLLNLRPHCWVSVDWPSASSRADSQLNDVLFIDGWRTGADPGFRRGVSYIQKGGFRTGISGADPNCCRVLGKSTSKKNCRQP